MRVRPRVLKGLRGFTRSLLTDHAGDRVCHPVLKVKTTPARSRLISDSLDSSIKCSELYNMFVLTAAVFIVDARVAQARFC